MKIRNRLNPSKPCFSFEFFPPKTAEGEKNLWSTLEDLRVLDPGFVSVTYGAGGSNRDKTIELVSQIKSRTGIEPVAHLTCLGHSKDELREILQKLKDAKIDNVLALRGDAPVGQPELKAGTDGLRYAKHLVDFIAAEQSHFCVGGAGYPEGHVETHSRDADLKHLKEKVDAGLDFVITQLFFDNAFYFDFVERARHIGINIPIIPGIMPITNFEQLGRFVKMCGVTVPMRLQMALERVKDSPESIMSLGVAHATVQCIELLNRGAPGIHFYTLNRSPATRMIVSALRARES